MSRGGPRVPGPGKRIGAPHKPEEEKTITISMSLPARIVEWLRSQPGSTSKVVAKIIDTEIQRHS